MNAAAERQTIERTESRAGARARGAVLLLAPQIFAHGGVQSYMRRLTAIIGDYCLDGGRSCVPLALGRRGGCEADCSDPAAASVVDAYGSKPRLVLNAFKQSLTTRADLAVVGHIGLGPVALALKTCGFVRSYITVLHGIEAWERLSPVDRIAAKGAAAAVATTNFTAHEFSRANDYPLERILVVPLAVGEDLPPRPSFPAVRDGLKVLTVGRLARCERYKGVDHLIDAVAALAGRGEPVTLDIVGDGDDAPVLKERALATGRPELFRFHGAVSDEVLRTLYRDCDIFAMPSLREGFGIVFLEAMRFGKPCIGGRHGGTPEVIQDGVNGFLVEHGSVEQLTLCLGELRANPDLCRALGERAYQSVVDKYCFSRMRSEWFQVLEASLDRAN